MFFRTTFFVVFFILFSSPLMARYLGNPAAYVGSGNLLFHIAYSGMSREYNIDLSNDTQRVTGTTEAAILQKTLIVDYGVTRSSTLRIEIGNLHSGFSKTDDTEYGFGYRLRIGKPTRTFGKYTLYGLALGIHEGAQSDPDNENIWGGKQREAEAILGASYTLLPKQNFYIGLVAGYQDLSFDVSGTSVTLVSKNPVGGIIGWEYVWNIKRSVIKKKPKVRKERRKRRKRIPKPKKIRLKFGIEYHFIFEQGVAAFARVRF